MSRRVAWFAFAILCIALYLWKSYCQRIYWRFFYTYVQTDWNTPYDEYLRPSMVTNPLAMEEENKVNSLDPIGGEIIEIRSRKSRKG